LARRSKSRTISESYGPNPRPTDRSPVEHSRDRARKGRSWGLTLRTRPRDSDFARLRRKPWAAAKRFCTTRIPQRTTQLPIRAPMEPLYLSPIFRRAGAHAKSRSACLHFVFRPSGREPFIADCSAPLDQCIAHYDLCTAASTVQRQLIENMEPPAGLERATC
jgi:hypothetical protein